MPNFEAQVRTDFRDVAGMVVSLSRDDIVEDVTNPGFVKKWVNRAPGLPSIPAIRQPGDPDPTYEGGRFRDPENIDTTTQPAISVVAGVQRGVQFDRARSSFLITPPVNAADGLDASQPLACAYQFTKGADSSNSQTIAATTSNTLQVERRNAAGNSEITANGSTIVTGDHADGTFVYTGRGSTPGTALWERNGAAYGTGDGDDESFADQDQFMLGQASGGADYLDGILDSYYLWMGQLSPRTLDFIWQTVNADGTAFNSDLRGPMSKPIWTDVTGDLSLNQVDRLHPQTGVPFRYILVSLPAAPALHRVQVAAAVDGVVLPDTALGGDEFEYTWIEVPGLPAIFPDVSATAQDAGWTSVVDIALNREGHYTLNVARVDAVTRTNTGGTVILHFDVQVAV